MSGRPVIVSTDGSVTSRRVLPHAALLAAAAGSPLLLLQVLLPQDIEREPGEAPEVALERARARIEAELRHVLERDGLEGEACVEVLGRDEKVAARLRRAVEERRAGVLALASQGHSMLRHVLHGSVALDVLSAPGVLLMMSGPRIELPSAHGLPYRVLATSDGSPASETVLKALAPVLAPGRFHVTLMRVHEREPLPQEDALRLAECEQSLRRLRDLLPADVDVDVFVREIPRGGGIDTAIIEKAMELDAHAIAMSTHGVTARRHVLMGSVATTMLGRSPLPLLLARMDFG